MSYCYASRRTSHLLLGLKCISQCFQAVVGLLNRIWFGNIWIAACSLLTNLVQSFPKKNKTSQCKNQHTQEKLKIMRSPLIFQLKKVCIFFLLLVRRVCAIHSLLFLFWQSCTYYGFGLARYRTVPVASTFLHNWY